jgi:LL-H family phage holin
MEFQVDLTRLILAIIGIMASVVSVYLIPLIKAKLGANKWDQFMKIVSVAVDAAEQLGLTDVAINKLEYAMQQVKLTMQKQGLTYDDATIRAAIESLVLQLNYQDAVYTVSDLTQLEEAGVVAKEEKEED